MTPYDDSGTWPVSTSTAWVIAPVGAASTTTITITGSTGTAWTTVDNFFYGDESNDHSAWMSIAVDSAPVCLKRPPVTAPCPLRIVTRYDLRKISKVFYDAHQIRGPPAEMRRAA